MENEGDTKITVQDWLDFLRLEVEILDHTEQAFTPRIIALGTLFVGSLLFTIFQQYPYNIMGVVGLSISVICIHHILKIMQMRNKMFREIQKIQLEILIGKLQDVKEIAKKVSTIRIHDKTTKYIDINRKKEDINMEAEKLLKKLEKEIDIRWVKNKLNFYWFGFRGDFSKIRKILGVEKLKEDEIGAFIGICDNRIDRLKLFSSNIIAVLIAFIIAIASILVALEIATLKHPFLNLLCKPGVVFEILFLIFILFLSPLIRYRAQIYAWYAVKEGVLLVKDE